MWIVLCYFSLQPESYVIQILNNGLTLAVSTEESKLFLQARASAIDCEEVKRQQSLVTCLIQLFPNACILQSVYICDN